MTTSTMAFAELAEKVPTSICCAAEFDTKRPFRALSAS